MSGEQSGAVGLRMLDLVDPSRPRWDGAGPRPIRTYLWYPAAAYGAQRLAGSESFAPANVVSDAAPRGGLYPTVLLSHGTGGSARNLHWLAEGLVAAGFVVLAVDHHGNNERDPYLPEGFICVWERPRDLSFALDALAGEGLIDSARVGAAGFSLGGYTAAALLGARLDAARYRELLVEGEDPGLPEFPNLLDAVRAKFSADELAALPTRAAEPVGDERVRAALLIAPAVGPLLALDSLATIRRPVAVYWGDADPIAPPAENAEVFARAIPGATGQSVGVEIGHYDFLAEGSDLHRRLVGEAAAFFRANLA